MADNYTDKPEKKIYTSAQGAFTAEQSDIDRSQLIILDSRGQPMGKAYYHKGWYLQIFEQGAFNSHELFELAHLLDVINRNHKL